MNKHFNKKIFIIVKRKYNNTDMFTINIKSKTLSKMFNYSPQKKVINQHIIKKFQLFLNRTVKGKILK